LLTGLPHARGRPACKVLIDVDDSFSGATRPISLRVPELTEEGRVTTRDRTLNVRIPKGIRPGQQIRLAGQGGPSGSIDLKIPANSR